MTMPAIPVSMITQPTIWMFRKEGCPRTAKARIAPIATRVSPVAVLMTVLLSLGRVPAGYAAAGLFAQLRSEHAAAQVAERAGEQSGHVHLRDAEPVPDLGLGHVAVEAHHEEALLALGEVAPVRPHRLHVERVLELGVVLAEQVGQVARL